MARVRLSIHKIYNIYMCIYIYMARAGLRIYTIYNMYIYELTRASSLHGTACDVNQKRGKARVNPK